ncbi:hypothetical protein [Xanthomonas rydalmerensis]|uniref:Uncharacterized protein n=1 Tax=Xanthomonas rydalmerensis TaxID=3046274 RepID=A0ABZ0JLK4_9XANT|nr:hypothetical protein [Xanthomonas sp. DM-2023]WOS40703.1 hypothetical protein QN243_20295 [Xanthomonas sp. DM-2023]WOS44887.1 hypothetical protein QN242_20295 [Xanthomonas sp. DM-2023]WOS49067.1 hypothetical protein QN240_20295 [Xanthomonas sp. DM-2023]WOS53247.1 hypothetical protein QN244_20300 [Xanthomonas sp. DM-2023]WOS57430.1 hypothetical protein QN245_20295 [Xanthomonas sp. DM-2023]
MSAIDPIDKLAASGISIRTLVSFQLDHLEWLAQHQGDTFRLCYHDEAGALVVETIKGDPAALLQRAQELGWQACKDEPAETGAPWIFQEAYYHQLRGAHWFSTATEDFIDEVVPLGFPSKMLDAARRRRERKYSPEAIAKRATAMARVIARDKLAREKAAESEYRGQHSAAARLLAKNYRDAADIIEKPITQRTALNKAKQFLKDCNDGDYNMWLARAARTNNGGAK